MKADQRRLKAMQFFPKGVTGSVAQSYSNLLGLLIFDQLGSVRPSGIHARSLLRNDALKFGLHVRRFFRAKAQISGHVAADRRDMHELIIGLHDMFFLTEAKNWRLYLNVHATRKITSTAMPVIQWIPSRTSDGR